MQILFSNSLNTSLYNLIFVFYLNLSKLYLNCFLKVQVLKTCAELFRVVFFLTITWLGLWKCFSLEFLLDVHWNSVLLCKLLMELSTWTLDPHCLGLNHKFCTIWLSDCGQVPLSLYFTICKIGIIVASAS